MDEMGLDYTRTFRKLAQIDLNENDDNNERMILFTKDLMSK